MNISFTYFSKIYSTQLTGIVSVICLIIQESGLIHMININVLHSWQHQYIKKRKDYEHWWNGRQWWNALIFQQILATNSFKKCMAIRLKIFYMDIGALKVVVASEVAPGGIPVCKYLKNQTYWREAKHNLNKNR